MGLRQVHPCTDALQCFSAGVVNLSEALRSLSVHPGATRKMVANVESRTSPRRWVRTTSYIASAMVHYAGHPICYAGNPPPGCNTRQGRGYLGRRYVLIKQHSEPPAVCLWLRIHIIIFHRDKGGQFQFFRKIFAAASLRSHPYTSCSDSEISDSSDQLPSHHSDHQ